MRPINDPNHLWFVQQVVPSESLLEKKNVVHVFVNDPQYMGIHTPIENVGHKSK